MGMYNEVFTSCPDPKCKGRGYGQISQIVPGFGGFNLDDPGSLAQKLNVSQLHSLKEAIAGAYFECQKCHQSFQLEEKEEGMDQRIELANKLFG